MCGPWEQAERGECGAQCVKMLQFGAKNSPQTVIIRRVTCEQFAAQSRHDAKVRSRRLKRLHRAPFRPAFRQLGPMEKASKRSLTRHCFLISPSGEGDPFLMFIRRELRVSRVWIVIARVKWYGRRTFVFVRGEAGHVNSFDTCVHRFCKINSPRGEKKVSSDSTKRKFFAENDAWPSKKTKKWKTKKKERRLLKPHGTKEMT